MSNLIKIGVDGRLIQGNLTGVGKYVLNLLKFICKNSNNFCVRIYSNRVIQCELDDKFDIIYDTQISSKIKPMLWSKIFSHRLINEDNPDIFFAGDTFVPFFLKSRIVVSVVHDFNSLVVPQTMSKLRLVSDKLFFKKDLQKASLIIANSFGTANKLKRFYNRPTNLVVHPILDERLKVINDDEVTSTLLKLGIKSPYILTVSTQEPRKNMDKIINAFLALKTQGELESYKLVLVGAKGWKAKNIADLITSNAEHILNLGYVSDEIMPYIYNGASMFVFPSSYEGFGMPAREAMLCGTNVITSDIPELREATFNLGSYVDPENILEIEQAIIDCSSKGKFAIEKMPVSDQLNRLIPAFLNLVTTGNHTDVC